MMNNAVEYLKETFKGNFDVKFRKIETSIGDVTFIFIDTLSSTQFISDYMIKPLELMGNEIKDFKEAAERVLNINDVAWLTEMKDILTHLLAGDVVVIAEGYPEALTSDVKSYSKRGVGTSDSEHVLKGPKEGFVEAFIDNVTLIRRKIRNPDLKVEVMRIGEKSNTIIALVYIKGVAPEKLVDKMRKGIMDVKSPFVLDTNYIEEKFKSTTTTFDTMGFTERPDTAASRIMEGRVAVIVDGTPFVTTAPHFFMENFQAGDDYYLNKYFCNFNRIIRWSAFLFSVLMPGLYLAISTYHFSLIPSVFLFRMAVARAGVPFPTVVEVILMMFFFQLIKEAGLRLPQPIGSAMSIVSGLVLGDAAVNAGIASTTTLVVVSISMLSYFLIPKLYAATSTWSLVIVLFSALLGLPGFYVGTILLISHIASLDSCGYSFIFPVGTMKKFRYRDIFLRGDLDNISWGVFKEEDEHEAS